jgi:hypothetical protein
MLSSPLSIRETRGLLYLLQEFPAFPYTGRATHWI